MTSTQTLDLIARVKERTYSGDRRFTSYLDIPLEWKPPMTEEAMQHAEQELGFSLPPLIRGLYLEVGSDEFGPGYGFQSLMTGPEAVIPHYKSLLRRSTPEILKKLGPWDHNPAMYWGNSASCLWPQKLLPFFYLGCEVYSCVDCSDDRLMVWAYDGTRFGEEPDNPLQIFRTDEFLPNVLEKWVAGQDPFK